MTTVFKRTKWKRDSALMRGARLTILLRGVEKHEKSYVSVS